MMNYLHIEMNLFYLITLFILTENSLGVLSKNIINDINNTVREEWGNNLISSWNDKWIELPNKVSKKNSFYT